MKISLTPVTLSAAELELIAAAARIEDKTVGEYIAGTSFAEALCELQRRPRDMVGRQRKDAQRPGSGPLPPNR